MGAAGFSRVSGLPGRDNVRMDKDGSRYTFFFVEVEVEEGEEVTRMC